MKLIKHLKSQKFDDNVLHESLLRIFSSNKINPDDTSVIVGFYKSKETIRLIIKK